MSMQDRAPRITSLEDGDIIQAIGYFDGLSFASVQRKGAYYKIRLSDIEDLFEISRHKHPH